VEIQREVEGKWSCEENYMTEKKEERKTKERIPSRNCFHTESTPKSNEQNEGTGLVTRREGRLTRAVN
jgi:hypothetical protein